MHLISINTAAATEFDGVLTLNVTYTDDGGATQTADYGWQVGDPYGLGPQLDAYMTAHPGLPITAYVPPAVTGEEVDIERERRIALPLAVATSVGNFSINMDTLAQRNLGGLASVGQYLVATGSSQTTDFRDMDNAMHALTPADLVGMGLQVAQRIQAVYAQSWAIKAIDPIPADYADDSRWA